MSRTHRTLVGLALPAAIALVATVPWVVAWSDMPDPVATHWDLAGHPDGHAPPAAALALLAAPALAGALVLAGVCAARGASVRRSPAAVAPDGTALVGVGAAALGGLFAVLSLGVVVANAGAASWRDADLPLPWALAAVAGLVAAGGVARAGIGPIRLGAPPATSLDGPGAGAGSLVLRPGERAGWVGAGHARWPGVTAGGLVVAAVVAAVVGALWLVATCALVALAVLLVGAVHVTIGVQGVRVASPVGWPAVTVPLDQITAARAIDLRPVDWGGWGYRGSLRLAGRAAWVVRRGEALELRLAGDRAFAVTVDGAVEAAAVVNALLDRSAQPS
jgi:Domain of unknown function (DUF1648)